MFFKNTKHINRGGLHSFLNSLFLIILFFLFASCENFLGGADLKAKLDKELAYASMQYSIVEIASDQNCTKSIVPAANVYEKNYKATDTISLKFEEKDTYQFLYWQSVPAEAVTFTDATQKETVATIAKTITQKIKIEPICAVRPVPTVSPDKTEGLKPKNTSIIVNFYPPLSMTGDIDSENYTASDLYKALNSISILNEAGVNIKDHFLEPKIDETKTSIIFESDNKNPLILTDGTMKITVKIPENTFYCLSGTTKVYMSDEKDFSFEVNNTTVHYSTITVSNNITNGICDVSGQFQLYEYSTKKLNFTLNEHCSFNTWIFRKTDGTLYTKDGNFIYSGEKKILEIEEPDEKTVAELFEKRIIQITLKSVPGVDENDIVVEPSSTLRIYSTGYVPSLTSIGVPCDTPIQIYFSKTVDIASFRFTTDEIPQNATNLLYDSEQRCYAYEIGYVTYFKNIKIENTNTFENVSGTFTCPILSENGMALILTPAYDKLLLPQYSSVFANLKISLNIDYSIVGAGSDSFEPTVMEMQIRFNSSRETEAPIVEDIILAKNLININKSLENDDSAIIFVDSDYTEWEPNDYARNQAGKISGYIKGYEPTNQLYKVKISETLLEKVKLDNANDISGTITVTAPETYQNYVDICFSQVENQPNTWEGNFNYVFKTQEDGIVEIIITVEDYNGNSSLPKTYYVNKDTAFNKLKNVYFSYSNLSSATGSYKFNYGNFLYSELNFLGAGSSSYKYYNYINEAADCVFWHMEDTYDYYLDLGVSTERSRDFPKNFEYEIRWSESLEGLEKSYYSSGRLSSSDCFMKGRSINANEEMGEYLYGYKMTDLDKEKDYYLKLIVYDRADNEAVFASVKYRKPQIFYNSFTTSEDESILKCSVLPYKNLPEGLTPIYNLYYHSGWTSYGDLVCISQTDPNFEVNIDSNHYAENDKIEFCVLVSFEGRWNSINNTSNKEEKYFSQASESIIANANEIVADDNNLNLAEKEAPGLLSSGLSTSTYIVTFSVEENNFDTLYVEYEGDSGSTARWMFASSETSVDAVINTRLLYNKTFNYSIVGIKGNTKKTITKNFFASSITYNIPPSLDPKYFTLDEKGQYLIVNAPESDMTIYESGIKCYYVEANNDSPYYYASARTDPAYGFNLTIPADIIRSFSTLPVTYYSNVDKSKIKIPIAELEAGQYLMCLDVKDTKGNVLCVPYMYFRKNNDTSNNDNLTINDEQIYYQCTMTNSGYYYYYLRWMYDTAISMNYYDETNNTNPWTNVFKNVCVFPTGLETGTTGYFSYFALTFGSADASRLIINFSDSKFTSEGNQPPSSTKINGVYDKFYKLYTRYSGATSIGTVGTSDGGNIKNYPMVDSYGAFYSKNVNNDSEVIELNGQTVVPYYFYASGENFGPTVCNVKKIKVGTSGLLAYYIAHGDEVMNFDDDNVIAVISDQPCLVQTLVSNRNWNDVSKTEIQNMYVWEENTVESNIKNIQVLRPENIGSQDTMIYQIPISEISSGQYYLVVVHYADGTSETVEVRQR